MSRTMAAENLAGRTIASYRLLERIGEGGTATVYRADHPEHGRCAVKILRERMRSAKTAVKRFLREADYGARVRHPHVVETYDFGEAEDLYYLALEWADGEPLADYIERHKTLAPALVAHIMQQLAGALAVAHAEGIVHRDLKPENIMFNGESRVAKLLDFGIARDQQEDPSERLTRTGFFVGSLNYVAPEALSGALVGESADIYSLATIAYYLLTGEHPYGGRSPREIFQQLLTQPPRPLRETSVGARLGQGIEATIMRSLSREPTERHPSAQAFADDLQHAAAGGPGGGGTAATAAADTGGSGLMGTIKSLFGRKREG
ncbi:MAG: serine/threonine-protein kinase [Synechococcaceae cyanobacterium]|nr:serine/threonine-protein kinase [Synechococcaceae cyanobacterium]